MCFVSALNCCWKPLSSHQGRTLGTTKKKHVGSLLLFTALVLNHWSWPIFLCCIPAYLWSSPPQPSLLILSFLASPCLTLYSWRVALSFPVLPPVTLTLPLVNAPPLLIRFWNPMNRCCSCQSLVTSRAPSLQVAHPICSSQLQNGHQVCCSIAYISPFPCDGRQCPILTHIHHSTYKNVEHVC